MTFPAVSIITHPGSVDKNALQLACLERHSPSCSVIAPGSYLIRVWLVMAEQHFLNYLLPIQLPLPSLLYFLSVSLDTRPYLVHQNFLQGAAIYTPEFQK